MSLRQEIKKNLPWLVPIVRTARRPYYWAYRRLVLPLRRRKEGFNYSIQWYEASYHKAHYHLDSRSYASVMREWESFGYKDRLYRVFDEVAVPKGCRFLEVACHHGKTAFWLAERHSDATFHMFDFSQVAVDWCQRNNLFPDRCFIWRGDVTKIEYKNDKLDDFFDLITCIDVTEHLPHPIYHTMLRELFRVAKPGGGLVLMQGNTPHVEHINVLPEEELVADVCAVGFMLAKHLPERHYLFIK